MKKCSLLLLLVFSFSLEASAQSTVNLTETPAPADSLVNSMGVNTHMTYAGTAYANDASVMQMLKTLGVRHIRDGGKYYPGQSGYNNEEFATFGSLATLGISFDLILDYNRGTDPFPMTPTYLEEIQALAKAHGVPVDSYEGPNEIDEGGVPTWIADTRTFMQSVYAAAKSNSATSGIPIVGNSMAGPPANYLLLGSMTASQDYGNMHPYANTQHPSYNFAYDLGNEVHLSGSQNIYITEMGWSNAMHTTDNSPNVSEDVAARYMGRVFFETKLRGWPRTYIYELVDQKPESAQTESQMHFGLFRSDYSAKPAATVIANTVELLSDKGGVVIPRTLTYSLTTSSGAVHHMLLQKSDGTYWLALWQEVSNWKGWNAQGTPITNPDVSVEIDLPMAATSVQTYRPKDSTAALESLTNQKTINVSVPDHVLLVKISLIAPASNLKASIIK